MNQLFYAWINNNLQRSKGDIHNMVDHEDDCYVLSVEKGSRGVAYLSMKT